MEINIKDKNFIPFISEKAINAAIDHLAEQINRDYQDRNPLFLGILNGAFIFAADLLRNLSFSAEISFVRLSSYQKSQSSGKVKVLFGLQEKVEGRDIIILEDIVDTGNTIKYLFSELESYHPKTIEIASLLLKPDVFDNSFSVKYVGKEIPNKFVIGYGLDYDGFGRNLKEIYKESE